VNNFAHAKEKTINENTTSRASFYSLEELKFLLINGYNSTARSYLEKIQFQDKQKNQQRLYLLLLSYFAEQRYHLVQDILDKNPALYTEHHKDVCLVGYLSLKLSFTEKKMPLECETYLESLQVSKLLPAHYFDSPEQSNKHKFNKLNNTSLNSTMQWIKNALINNQIEQLKEKIELVPSVYYFYPEARELAAFAYYRIGKYEKAFELIDDLKSTNANLIKGSQALSKNQYELAYGLFNLAHKNKPSSVNALERLLLSAIRVNKWESAESAIQALIKLKPNQELASRYFLLSNIQNLLDKRKAAQISLNKAKLKYGSFPPLNLKLTQFTHSLSNAEDENFDLVAYQLCQKGSSLICSLYKHYLLNEKDFSQFLSYFEQNPIQQFNSKLILQEPWSEKVEFFTQSMVEEQDNPAFIFLD
jgi:hypothetical protein